MYHTIVFTIGLDSCVLVGPFLLGLFSLYSFVPVVCISYIGISFACCADNIHLVPRRICNSFGALRLTEVYQVYVTTSLCVSLLRMRNQNTGCSDLIE